ncbi:TERT [Mytilus coruscus]|uniref:Telomerase reverse transcriptase n=1 Tax=Mytilus coruscus TaxID=42192 RepID=A0A6J8EZE9_MYTCO|nr:TERT [Mytilus coruscus]
MDIISQVYTHTWKLEEWLTLVDISDNLFQDTDSLQYTDVLKTTIVADKQKELPTFHSFSQVSQQRELLLHVIQKLKKRNEKNVLILGFSAASDDIGAQVSHIHNLEYRYPNSCFNRLQYPVWSKLLSRISDGVMTYMLENTSMFQLVPTSCYVQFVMYLQLCIYRISDGVMTYMLENTSMFLLVPTSCYVQFVMHLQLCIYRISDGVMTYMLENTSMFLLVPTSCYVQFVMYLQDRIGDVVMTYLLENTSMFLLVPTSCYVQCTGVPIYELWPMQPGKYLSIPQKTTNTKSFKRKKECTQTNSYKKPRCNENQTNIRNETTTNSQDQANINSCFQANVRRKPEATCSEDKTNNSIGNTTTNNEDQANINSCSQANVSSKPEATQRQNQTKTSTVNATTTNDEDQSNIKSCSQANINSCSQANISRKPEATHSEDLTNNSTVTSTNTYKEDQANIISCFQANVSSNPVNREDQANINMDAQTYTSTGFIKVTGESPSIERYGNVQIHNGRKTSENFNREDHLNTTFEVKVTLNSHAEQNIREETLSNIDGQLPQPINNSDHQDYTNKEDQSNTGSDTQSCANKETRLNDIVNIGTYLSGQKIPVPNTKDSQIARETVSRQPKKYALELQNDDNFRLTNILNAASNKTARSEISSEKGTVCDDGNSNMQFRSREIIAEKICDRIPDQAFTVIDTEQDQHTRPINNKVSVNNKKKRRKRKSQDIRNFHHMNILNLIPSTEDGALTLYRHILEHKQTIKASKVTISWRFPEHSVNSIGNESSCCASTTHNITELAVEDNTDIVDHSSFFGTTYSYDKVLTKFNEKETNENSKKSLENNQDLTVAEICDTYKQKKLQIHVDAEIKNQGCSVSRNLISNSSQNSQTTELNTVELSIKSRLQSENKASGRSQDYASRNLTENSLWFEANKNIPVHEDALGIETSVIDDTLSNSQGFNTYSFDDSQGFETSGNEDSGTISYKCKESFDGTFSFDSKSDIPVIEDSKSLSQSFDYKTFSIESEKSVSILSKVKSEDDGCFTKIKSKKSELCLDNIDKQFSSTPLEENENQSSKPNLSKIDHDDNWPLKSRECKRSIKRKHVDDLEIFHPADKRPRLSLDVSSVPESKDSPIKTYVEMEVEESMAEVIEKINDSSNEIRLPTTEEEAKEKRPASKNEMVCKSTVCGDKVTSSKGEKCDLQSIQQEDTKDAELSTIEVDYLPALCHLLQQILTKHRTDLQKLITSNKYDKLCIGQMMSGIKVSSISWLRTVKSNSVRQHIMAKVWHWIIEEFVINVIKTFFYVTDTTQHVNRLFYYRKRTWHWLHVKALTDLKKRNIMKLITEDSAKQLITERQSLGVATLRFFPKSKGLRPIINLGRQQTLFGISKIHPHIVGAAKFGQDEVYRTWKTFAVKQSLPLYFVKTDISSCYDEILQQKLFCIVKNIFNNVSIILKMGNPSKFAPDYRIDDNISPDSKEKFKSENGKYLGQGFYIR